jgi:hypothetical protein
VAWRLLQETKALMEERESEILREALARHGGVVAHAAKELGIARTTLAGRIEALGISRRLGQLTAARTSSAPVFRDDEPPSHDGIRREPDTSTA